MGSNKKKTQRHRYSFSSKKFNKYTITACLFLAWLIFFDKNNLINQFKLDRAVNKLEKQKEEYEHKLNEVEKEKLEIEKDKEKYAREKYYMHKKNEEVFIIEKSKE